MERCSLLIRLKITLNYESNVNWCRIPHRLRYILSPCIRRFDEWLRDFVIPSCSVCNTKAHLAHLRSRNFLQIVTICMRHKVYNIAYMFPVTRNITLTLFAFSTSLPECAENSISQTIYRVMLPKGWDDASAHVKILTIFPRMALTH